ERAELLPERLVALAVAAPELVPAGRVHARVTREDRRERRILQLERVARDDAHPRPPGGEHGREADDVVLDDHVRPELVQALGEPLLDVVRAVHELLPDREDQALELVDRRPAELRRGVMDEVLPELARLLLDLGLRLQAHQRLLEALRLERPRKRLLDDEDDARAALAQHTADPDAVVR